jgi:hypothetical protein
MQRDWRPPEPACDIFDSFGRRWPNGRVDLTPSTKELGQGFRLIQAEDATGHAHHCRKVRSRPT